MLFSIRKSLSIVLLILTALYAISATINTMSAISEYRRALKIHYNNIIADALFDAVQHYGFERGRVNVVLRDAGPVSQMESNRIFIRQQRDAGDDALKNAMDRIKMAGLFTPEVDRITSQWTAVQYLRADGDRECSIPLAERTKELVPRWFETMTSFINSIETLLEALSSDEDNFDAMARELFYLKMRTLALRNTSGPECSMVLASYGTNGTLPAEDLKKIFSLRGASTLLVEDVASAVQRIRDPRLKEAMLNFRQLYEQEFLPIQRASLDAIYSGAPLPLERAQYSKIMVDALKSIAPVMEASIAVTRDHIDATLENARTKSLLRIGLFLTFLALALLMLLFVKDKVSNRIKTMAQVMTGLSSNQDCEIPYQAAADEVGEMARSVVVFRENMIRRREADAHLLKDLEDRRTLLDTIPQQVWYQSDEHTYGVVNESHAKFLGKPINEIEFSKLADVMPEHAKATEASAGVIAARETVISEEWTRNAAGEPRLLNITRHPKFAVDGRFEYLVCSAEDITEQRQAEQFRDDVERIIRHDIKSPLMGLHSLATYAMEGACVPFSEIAPMMVKSVQQVMKLIDSSDKLHRMEQGTYRPHCTLFPLSAPMQSITTAVRQLCELRHVSIRLDKGEDILVFGEEFLIEDMLLNTIKNAVEASMPGSEVLVTGFQDDDCVLLDVKNPGVMDQAIGARVFEKYATQGKTHGTGLGAYSARLIARTHSGDIWFESSPILGTVFHIKLPIPKANLENSENLHTVLSDKSPMTG